MRQGSAGFYPAQNLWVGGGSVGEQGRYSLQPWRLKEVDTGGGCVPCHAKPKHKLILGFPIYKFGEEGEGGSGRWRVLGGQNVGKHTLFGFMHINSRSVIMSCNTFFYVILESIGHGCQTTLPERLFHLLTGDVSDLLLLLKGELNRLQLLITESR